ncbi:hypothetical protein L1987_08188 [Smallanthus sonchifolius]|uniref:Uncharacterized protein n=1 Tax=Smallanthus sonchifolius TaxID=185202 RepID=A0ACB9JM69_9ASTR|nr:hypothetical protein L1987_08188 [Smallanthus sonchifolius]
MENSRQSLIPSFLYSSSVKNGFDFENVMASKRNSSTNCRLRFLRHRPLREEALWCRLRASQLIQELADS